ncbi:MAG: DUF58 domain-containing protein [Lachnospiraceae bacterium]|nr:DUF58 domain-containing protein [Lachnospiraceae bacterium]
MKRKYDRKKREVNNGLRTRRWILFGLWILSLFSISFYGGAISYGFFFGVTLIPVVSAVYLLAVYLRFKIYQRLESRNMVCGQPVPYIFVLQNDDWFAFTSISVRLFTSLSYVEELPDGIEYELLPGDRFTFRTELVCKYRGEYEVGVKKIVITDFLRLFQISYRVPAAIKALVRPRIIRVSELHCIADISALLQREAYTAQTETDVVVRDYVSGDALKQIHWKATAREQKLKVRNRTGEEKTGITILCDTKRYARDNREYLPLENKILEVLLAIGIFLSERNMTYEVCYGQRGMVRRRVQGVKDFDAFYRQVSDMEFREEEAVENICRQTMAEGAWANSRIVFLVLHEWDDAVWEMTEQMAAGGVIVVICLITDENMDQYRRYSSIRKRIVVIPVEAQLEGRL